MMNRKMAPPPDYPPGSFDFLRPFCVQLTLEQTVSNVKKLRAQIAMTEVCVLESLMEYVLFPMRFSLRSKPHKEASFMQALLECISYFFSLVSLKRRDIFLDLYSEMSTGLGSESFEKFPEELKLALTSAMHSLIRSATSDVIPLLYDPCMIAELGFSINMLLNVAENEKSRELRLEALNCLGAILLQDVEVTFSKGDIFATYFPGVSTTLTKIICGDPNQGYRLTSTAVHVWAGTVCMMLSDKSLMEKSSEKPEFSTLHKSIQKVLIQRDKEWVLTTALHLVNHVERITERCTADPHWKVRLELVNMGHLLLTRCWKALVESSGIFLQILVGHMSDEKPEVKEKALEALQDVTIEGPASRSLGEVLSENLHAHAVTLPRLLSSQDDNGKLHTLALLQGYLRLLGSRLAFTLRSSTHLQRLSSALLQTLELDISAMKVVEERAPAYESPFKHGITTAGASQKSFRFFRDLRVLCFIQSVCRLLGYYGDFRLLTDHFLGMYRAKRLPAILVLNQLVLGAAGIAVETMDDGSKAMTSEELLEAVRPLLDEYIDPSNWCLQTNNDTGELEDQLSLLNIGTTAKPSVQDMSFNAWKICLQLEGIACFAQAVGFSFRSLLITSLYPLLEKAGDTSLLVSGAAKSTLNAVSVFSGYKDISQLVELNADYLASEISVGLRRLRRCHGGAACVLRAVLECCGPNILPLLEDLVQDVLPALDQSPEEVAKILLPVLSSLIIYIGKWLGPQDEAEKLAEVKPKMRGHPGNLAKEIQEFFKGHMEQKRLAQGEVCEEECADVVPPGLTNNDEEDTGIMFTNIKISKEVAERCTHFLSHSDPHIRIKAMDTLRLAIIQLDSQENVLLPLAHKVWPCLVKRLIHEEPLILQRAFEVLVCLATSCRDFLRQRVCKEAFPAFLSFLRSQAPISGRVSTVYSHSQAFKLQLTMLEGLGKLCASLGLCDGDILDVADACMLYLSTRQPKKLQIAATSTFFTLVEIDPDIIWLYLCKWQSPPPLPHSSLKPLQWTARPHDEYTQNVSKILQKLH
ncbi:TELO2-interacting 1 homolog [Pelobates cultripes]|uniref:TELO2-interacting 1 homolog n=1 Tax=Pelobates cultripes TaxID=61616 RepID=A0AAD1S3Q9_PELCU|nr:TELO2-interacting 1 homolog [Pelobates cultripes]